jgi:hypothetical protein
LKVQITQLHMMRMDSIAQFFTRYPPNVSELAASLRDAIRSAVPDAFETLDEPGRVVGYAVGSGYSGLVCTIIPSKTGVKLGIVRGAELPDPQGLLEGTGKRHRYVQFDKASDLDRAGIEELLRAAREAVNPTRGV